MADHVPLVLNEHGLMEVLQPEDSVWKSLLFSDIEDGDVLGFGERTTLYSDENSGLILETNVDGDLFIIKNNQDTIAFKFGSDGTFVLPSSIAPEPISGALWYDGNSLYLGGN